MSPAESRVRLIRVSWKTTKGMCVLRRLCHLELYLPLTGRVSFDPLVKVLSGFSTHRSCFSPYGDQPSERGRESVEMSRPLSHFPPDLASVSVLFEATFFNSLLRRRLIREAFPGHCLTCFSFPCNAYPSLTRCHVFFSLFLLDSFRVGC